MQSTTLFIIKRYNLPFLLFDTGEKGGITLKDLKRSVIESRENITDIEIHGMMEEADKDSDGIVVVDDFIRLMKKRGEGRFFSFLTFSIW
jgi:Ca2+-binding EF-hand superfamily protein